jgi:subtilase family serine protease
MAAVPGTLPQPAGLKLGSAVPSGTIIAGSLSFPGTDPAGQVKLADEINDPSSPLYHHYLVNDQFNQMFAPSTAMQSSLTSYLQSYGVGITVVSPYLWQLIAPSSSMGAAFGTTFVSASSPGHTGYYPVTSIKLPSEFTGQVTIGGGFQSVDPPQPAALLRAPTLFQSSAPATPASPHATLAVNVTNPYILEYQKKGPLAFPPSGMNLTWNITLTGGTAPYSVTVHWGDTGIQRFTTSTSPLQEIHMFYVIGQADYCYNAVCGNITIYVTDAAAGNASIKVQLVPMASPLAVEEYYNALPLYKLGDTGAGTKIGLDEMCDTSYSSYMADANKFSAMMKLPTFTSTTLDLMGTGAKTCSGGSSGWSGETMLDIESAHAIAPNATIDVDLADSTLDEGDVTWNTLSNGVYIASNSWGSGSQYSSWTTADTQGQSYLTATGDCGSAGMTSAAPATSQHGVAVGGTQIYPYSSGVFRTEFAWNGTTDPSGCSNDEGSTGGYATSITAPWFQTGMTGFSDADRGIPDVAAIGGTWFWMYDAGVTGSAGTSLACPSTAAMLDLIYQYNATATKANGMADHDMYDIAKTSADYNIGFHDVIVGNNKVSGSGYNAGTGWDAVTGLGSLNIGQMAQLMAAWNGNPSPYSAITPVIMSNVTFGSPGLSVSFGADVMGGTSALSGYSYTWMFGDGTSTTTSTYYNTVHVYTSPGFYKASVIVNESTDTGQSAPITIHVTGTTTASTLTSVAVSPTTPTVGTSSATVFTATPTCSSTCPGTITYAWALTSTSLGTLSGSGTTDTFNAGTTAGTVGLYVNATLSGVTKTASTIITVQAVSLSSVALAPTLPTVSTSSSTPFTATPTCSATCPGTITYVWALTSTTLGSLSGSGATETFAASTTAGTVGIYVNATLSGVTKTASTVITVTTTPTTLSSVAVSPTTPTVAASGNQLFTATPTCSATCPGTITYTWALTSTALGTLSGSGSTDTFTAGTTAGTVGIYVNATLSGTTKGASTIITVSAAPVTLSSVAVSPLTPTVPESTQQAFTATPTCSATCPGTITYAWALTSATLGTLAGSGNTDTFTAGTTAGTVGMYVNATLGATTVSTSTIITVSETTSLTGVTLSPTTPNVASGSQTVFTATPTCTPSCPGSGISYVWALSSTSLGTLSGSATTDTFTAGTTAGTVSIYVNATYNSVTQGAKTMITVNGPTLNSVAVTPQDPTVTASSQKSFTATPSCTPSCPTSGIGYTWSLTSTSLGSLSGSGSSVTFTALTTSGTVGIFVNATLSTTKVLANTVITVTGTSNTLNSVALSPSAPTVASGNTQTFTATPSCTSTCPATVSYVWALTSSTLGSITGTGASVTFTAGTAAVTGGIFVNATLSGTTQKASTVITVTVSSTGTLNAVSLSPLSISVGTGAQETFTATATCTGSGGSSVTCPSGLTFSWSLSNATDGTITSTSDTSTTAIFTAGNTAGPEVLTVTATLNSVSVKGTSTITITSSGTTSSGLSTMDLLLIVIVVVAVVAVVVAVMVMRRKPKPQAQPEQPDASAQQWAPQPTYAPQPQEPMGGVSSGDGFVPPTQ